MIDIGANLTHASFKDDLADVVTRARAHGVTTLVVTGTTAEESRQAAEIAERFDLYSTAGIHPHHAKDFKDVSELKGIASHPRVVAIGECGLDFNRNYNVTFDVGVPEPQILVMAPFAAIICLLSRRHCFSIRLRR